MTEEVILHIYDVTNSESQKTNNAIVQLNKILRDRIGLGGIFHSGVQIYGEEWSFGYCESGSGVFSCPPKENPMYTYRESMFLGCTPLSDIKVNQVLTELSREWPGYSYDLLSKNCNHFCDKFCEKLGVQKLPAWVNRFANIGDTTVEIAQNTMLWLRQAKTDIMSASRFAFEFIFRGASISSVSPEPVPIQGMTIGNSNNNMFQASSFKNRVCLIPRISSRWQDAATAEKLQKSFSKDDSELGGAFSSHMGSPLAERI